MVTSKELILTFIKSITLDDHMGDVCDSINAMLWRLGMDLDWDDLADLRNKLDEVGVPDWYDIEHSEICICYQCRSLKCGS